MSPHLAQSEESLEILHDVGGRENNERHFMTVRREHSMNSGNTKLLSQTRNL